jgi:condensin complex subunit 3
MVSISQIAIQLVDWTNPRRLVDLSKSNIERGSSEDTMMRNASVHVDLASSIMTQMRKGTSMKNHDIADYLEEEKKALCSMLTKLYITAEADADKLKELYEEVSDAVNGKVVSDALSKSALNRFEQSMSKIVGSMQAE